jgi:tetratricopeptide (TPR) repeat protein
MARYFSLLVACGLLALGAPAHAEDGELKQKAQELLTEGNKLAAEGDFGLALDKFRAAYELFPSPKLLLNIGTSLRQIGRNAEAYATYEAYLAHPEADPSRTDELEKILRDLDALVGRVEIAVPDGDVRVSLDGKVLRSYHSGDTIRVDPGDHTVVAETEGRPATVKHVAVRARRTVSVELSFEETTPEESGPDVRVVIGFGLAGLGGAGIVVGAVLGGISLATKSDAEDHCAEDGPYAGYCSAEGADLLKSARTEGVAATATFIAGFAIAASGLALAFSAPSNNEEADDERAEDEAAEVTARVGPGGVELVVRW